MDKKALNILLLIAMLGLAVAALIFIFVNMFSSTAPEWALPAGLFCIVLGNLFGIIRSKLL